MDDVVVDTNVFEQCASPVSAPAREAKAFLQSLLDVETHLVVDDVFSLEPAVNRSLIVHEYLDRLRKPGHFGLVVLTTLAGRGRIDIKRASLPPAKRRRLVRLVPKDARDRTFVETATAATSRVLVSHDFDDFSDDVRDCLEVEFAVCVIDARSCEARL